MKHWMDPKIIPFGWGLFRDDDEVLVIERGGAKTNMITIISKTHTKINKKRWFYHWVYLELSLSESWISHHIVHLSGTYRKQSNNVEGGTLWTTIGNISGSVVGSGLRLRRALICQFKGADRPNLLSCLPRQFLHQQS